MGRSWDWKSPTSYRKTTAFWTKKSPWWCTTPTSSLSKPISSTVWNRSTSVQLSRSETWWMLRISFCSSSYPGRPARYNRACLRICHKRSSIKIAWLKIWLSTLISTTSTSLSICLNRNRSSPTRSKATMLFCSRS